MIRNPVVSGQFYPRTPSQLTTMIKEMVDEKAVKEELIGLVLPHAGYIYSGPVAGAVIAKTKFKDTFVIIGPSHTGRGKPLSIMTQGTWKTPLGEVEIDSELSKQFLATSNHLEEDYIAHQYEHSIEVQLPFLQYFKKDIKIVTNALNIALMLGTKFSFEILMTGGEFKAPTLSLTGEKAALLLQQIHINKLFLATAGISFISGLSYPSFSDLYVKKAMINCAYETYLVADSTKIGKNAFAAIGCLDQIDYLITDSGIKKEDKIEFEKIGIKVIIAE